MRIFIQEETDAICIGDDITILILSIDGDQVRLAIDAPNEPEIHARYLQISEEPPAIKQPDNGQ